MIRLGWCQAIQFADIVRCAAWYDVSPRQHRRLILLIYADYHHAVTARHEADASGAGSFQDRGCRCCVRPGPHTAVERAHAASDDMGWSPCATVRVVAGGSGNSVPTREELIHAKIGDQPSHNFQVDDVESLARDAHVRVAIMTATHGRLSILTGGGMEQNRSRSRMRRSDRPERRTSRRRRS